MAYIGKEPIVGNFQKCDAITVVNGQAAYTLQVSSTNVVPESANHMLVSLNGILQAPVTSFTVSGSTLTFASNLATGDVIDFVILLGNVLDLGTPSDGTVTNAKLAQDIISGETALATPPATTDELLVSDAGTLKRIDFSLLGNTPSFRVTLSGDQGSVANETFTKVAFDTETWDTDSAFASNKFTVPANQGGKYCFISRIAIDNIDSTEHIDSAYYKNGSRDDSSYQTDWMSKTTNGFGFVNNVHTMTLAATDYVELYAAHSEGSSQSIEADYTFFSGFKLIGTQ
jgi:hypothetical protein